MELKKQKKEHDHDLQTPWNKENKRKNMKLWWMIIMGGFVCVYIVASL